VSTKQNKCAFVDLLYYDTICIVKCSSSIFFLRNYVFIQSLTLNEKKFFKTVLLKFNRDYDFCKFSDSHIPESHVSSS